MYGRVMIDKCYTVEWCEDDSNLDDINPLDLDRLSKSFKTLRAAERFAEKIYPNDRFGCVELDEMTKTRHVEGSVYDWECARTCHYSGEWEGWNE